MNEQFARLGIAVDTQPVARARDELGSFVRAGRSASDAALDLEQKTGRAGRRMDRFGREVRDTTSSVSAIGRSIRSMALGLASLASAQQAIAQARGFNSALAETSTLIQGTRLEMAFLRDESLELASAYGGSAEQQVRAFYQAISAGADSVQDAAKIIDQSNRLAIGGVTDVTTGVDALTTAINAYSATGLTAAEASDAMFIGMRAGKTTIGELSAQMGQIVPIASAAGVSFDEMIAGISALTTQGQSTAIATTGLRAAITGILQPSKQASDAAKLLGLEFSASALQAKGLEEFMADVVKQTGGSTDAMTELFGSVEALNAVLAFSGAAGQTFTDIMADMSEKAGATDEAFSKVAEEMDQRLNAAFGKFGALVTQVGDVLLHIGVPALEVMAAGAGFLSENFNSLIGVIAATGIAAATAYAPAVYGAVTATRAWVASLIGLRGALLATGVGALVVGAGLLIGKMLDLVDATGGWGSALELLGEVASGIWEGVKTSASALVPALGALWADMHASFVRVLQDMSLAWGNFLWGLGSRLEGIPLFEGVAQGLKNASDAAIDSFLELDAKASGLEGTAIRLREEAKELASDGFAKAAEAAEKLRVQVESTADSSSAGTDAADELNRALAKLGKGAGKATQKLIDEAKALKASLDPMEKYRQELEKLTRLQGLLSEDEMAKAMRNLNIELADSLPLVGDLTDAFFDDLFSKFDDGLDGMKDAFVGFLKQLAIEATKNQIVIGLGLAGGTSAGGAAQASAGGGFLSGVLGQGAGSLLGGAGLLAGVSGGAAATLGLGSYASAGFFNIGANAATASAFTGAGALATTIGAALPVIAGIGVLVKGFSRSFNFSALEGTVGAGTFDGFTRDNYKGGWFRSDKNVIGILDPALEGGIADQVAAITDGLLDFGDALGLGRDALDDYEGYFLSVMTSRRTQEQIAADISSELSAAADEMAELILQTTQFSRLGESASETLTRLGSNLLAVNDVMDLLNGTLFEASLSGGDRATHLAELFGGLEGMAAATGVYWQAFYSDAERIETLTRRLSEEFGELGLEMPASREGFRDLVSGLDLTTSGGRELYAELVGMAGAIDQVLPQIGSFNAEILGMIDGINIDLTAQHAAALDAQRGALEAARLWFQTSDTLRDFLADLSGDIGGRGQALIVNQARFQTATGMAMSGDAEAARDIPGLARAYLDSALASSSSSLEYRRIVAQVQGQVQAVEAIAELTGTQEDRLATLYEQQVSVLGSLQEYLQSDGVTAEGLTEFRAAIHNLDGAIQDTSAFEVQSIVGLGGSIDLARDTIGLAAGRFDDAGRRIVTEFGAVGDEIGLSLSDFVLGIPTEVDLESSALRHALRQLGDTIDADRVSREVAALEARGVAAAASLTSSREGAVDVRDQLKALFAANGVVNRGGGFHIGAGGALVSGADYFESSQGWEGIMTALADTFGVSGGTLRERVSAVLAQVNDPLSQGREDLRALRQAYRELTGSAPSFSGGGYTGNAPRSGGLDGEGGFLAMLHPQETVVDHARSGGGGSSDVVAELRALRSDVSRLNSELADLKNHVKRADFMKIRNSNDQLRLAEKADVVGVKISG